ncbi:MAG: bacteriophage Gp15 family protein [Oscillospiraceae bacterium]|nr:bacteriophage Gp15 family protein [Oscillospiraceae bacterium]
MNALINTFPTKVEIDNVEYHLNTNFRNCLDIILAFEDEGLTQSEKVEVLLSLIYVDKNIPSNIERAIELAVKFLDCGEDTSKKVQEGISGRFYSFDKDAKYIYSAIKQTHNVDLESVEYLHWWKFVYMFLDLDKECFFSQLVYMRQQKAKGKLTKEEKQYYMSIREIADLDYTDELSEEEDEFMRLYKTV